MGCLEVLVWLEAEGAVVLGRGRGREFNTPERFLFQRGRLATVRSVTLGVSP